MELQFSLSSNSIFGHSGNSSFLPDILRLKQDFHSTVLAGAQLRCEAISLNWIASNFYIVSRQKKVEMFQLILCPLRGCLASTN